MLSPPCLFLDGRFERFWGVSVSFLVLTVSRPSWFLLNGRFERRPFNQIEPERKTGRKSSMFQISFVHVKLFLLLHDVVVDLQIAPGALSRNPVKGSAVALFPGRNDQEIGRVKFCWWRVEIVSGVSVGHRRLGNEDFGVNRCCCCCWWCFCCC